MAKAQRVRRPFEHLKQPAAIPGPKTEWWQGYNIGLRDGQQLMWTQQRIAAFECIVAQMEDYVEDGHVADEDGSNTVALRLCRHMLNELGSDRNAELWEGMYAAAKPTLDLFMEEESDASAT